MPIHTSTILARTPKGIHSHVEKLSKRFPNHTLLFALSPNVDGSELSNLVDRLTGFSSQTIGCLSAPLPGERNRNLISCSLAIFRKDSSTVFRSTIPGKASVQVGRWHAFRKKEEDIDFGDGGIADGNVNWEDVWGRNTGGNLLPPDLQHLSRKDVNAVVYLSDSASEGLSNSLANFPLAIKLGLTATSTPFITGRPVTLFHNQKIYSSGAIGIAVTRQSKPRAGNLFLGTHALTLPLTITRSEGNLINLLDKKNPTQILLAAIRKSGMDMDAKGSFKDDEKFYLGALHGGVVTQMYNINSGDPSRGTISLESDSAPPLGTEVQFFHRPKSTTVEIPQEFYATQRLENEPSKRTVAFMVSDAEASESSAPREEDEEAVQVLPNTFLASSENGFMLSRPGVEDSAWRCTVPGGIASLEWS